MHNYPLCIERNRMCCHTVIVSHSPAMVWNLQCQIRIPAGLSIHKFLMRSLSCWILKASGVTEVVLVGEQESINHQDVFLPFMIRLPVPSFQKKHCPNSVTTVHMKEKRSIYESSTWWCVSVCARVFGEWFIHKCCCVPVKHSCAGRRPSQVIASSHRTLTSIPSYTADVCFLCPQREKMAGKLLQWQGCNTEGKALCC